MRTSPPASAPLRPGPAQAYSLHRQETRGLALGLLGVAIFALTLPMTRLAVGTPEAPLMSGLFIAMGRAAVAGVLSALLLIAQRAPCRAGPTGGRWPSQRWVWCSGFRCSAPSPCAM